MSMHAILLCSLLLVPGALQDTPQDAGEVSTGAPLEGHSFHGEVFNEGPRQAAYLMDNPDSVHFPVSTESDLVQRFFDQGIGQLHGFWYFEAERSFRQVAKLDKDCAMAYWGMSMANADNAKRAKGFARAAWLRRGLTSPREQMYIDALARFHDVEGPDEPKSEEPESVEEDGDNAKAKIKEAKAKKQSPEERKKAADKKRDETKKRAARLVKDYEDIVWEYPDDLEAKAFLINRLWLNNRFGLPISSRQANEALLQQIFAVQPNHPVHHYRIHLWDDPDQAEHVVSTAVASGPSWPPTAHMWHMGGHIFARLGRHTDAAWQQEASARVDHRFMMKDRVLPDQIHNFAHNNEWLTRSMRHHGRMREAVALAKNMIELPRHPQFNMLDKRGCSASYGRLRLLETLELFEQWDELIALSKTMYLEPSDEATDGAQRAYALGKAHAYLQDETGFDEQIAVLQALIEKVKDERIEELESVEEEALAEHLDRDDILAAMGEVLDERENDLDGLRDKLEALSALRAALDETQQKDQLDDNLKILKESRFAKEHLALLCLAAGRTKEALELAREAAEKADGQLFPHATLAHVLHATGETEEALDVFDELREWTARADLDLPVFQRLAPLAELRGLPADWRIEQTIPEDVAGRQDLATLGPLRWTPPPALAWTCPDGFGQEVSLSDYAGKPVLVIFFLGFKCVHCVEQLGVFAPVTDQYKDAGIEIVTIGTQSTKKLAMALFEEDDYPFPILADPECEAFKRYRAYDDFEDQPLHGTFLVDGQGRVRWQDISYEPFMEWEFLLAESQRLLGLPVADDAHRSVTGALSPGEPSLSGGR